MDDELERFIKEQKAKVAEDKASFEQDPPYMEIRTKPHKAYDATIKENIPPFKRSTAQGKEDGYFASLPLGVEYERKKQKLQQELRMDYRRFMAQKSHRDAGDPGLSFPLVERRFVKEPRPPSFPPEGRFSPRAPEQRPPSRRDVATLTEGRRGVHRTLRPVERRAPWPEDEQPLATRERSRLERLARLLARYESEEEYSEEELDVAESRRDRHTEQEPGAESRRQRRLYRDVSRLRDRRAELSEEFMDPSDRLDRDRKENGTGGTRLSRRSRTSTNKDDAEFATGLMIGDADAEAALQRKKERYRLELQEQIAEQQRNKKREKDLELRVAATGATDPEKQPDRIIQFGRRLHNGQEPPLQAGSRGNDDKLCAGDRERPPPEMPRMAFQSPLLEYSLDLGLGTAGLAPSSQPPTNTLPRGIHTSRPSGQATSLGSGIAVFPAERDRPFKDGNVSYKEALKQQIQERQERQRLEQEERERYEAQLEADMKRHQPWGRGGGGAPLRDCTGNLIADLKQMHKQNEEAYINPEQWQQKRSAVSLSAPREDRPCSNGRVSGFAHVNTPQFARGNVFTNQPSHQQLLEQDKYKADLKKQIEEKRRKQAEERERVRQEEEKEERRLAEQRAAIHKEYEEEQEKRRRKEMEQKAKNEELIRLAEERKKEVDRKKREAEEKENAELRRQYEKERQARLEQVDREPSPPIPTLQKRYRPPHYTPTPPALESRRSTAPLSERSLSGLQSPPVPARKNQLRAAEEQQSVFNELFALRRQLRSEQKRLEEQLLQAEWEGLESPLSDRYQERAQVDVFDMARLRLQAPVRRPLSRSNEPSNLLKIHDSLQLKYTNGGSKASSNEAPREGEESLDTQRKGQHYDQQCHSDRLRRRTDEDYLDLSPPQQNHYLKTSMEDPTRGSLLESESAFIDPLGDAFPVPPSPDQKAPQLSARERRRMARRTESLYDQGVSSEPTGQSESCPQTGADPNGQQDREQKRSSRTRRLLDLSCHAHTAGVVGLSDNEEDEASLPSSPRGPDPRSSVESGATDPWLRPGTSDTLKRLMSGPSRRDRLTLREYTA